MEFKYQEYNLSRRQFVMSLTKKGYKCIGSGAFARTYAKPGSKEVIKVGECGKDGYLNWIKHADPKNPFFPKVKEVCVFTSFDDFGDKERFYFVKMERLQPVRDRYDLIDKFCEKLGLNEIFDLEYSGSLHKIMKRKKTNKSFKTICKVLISLYKRDCSGDIHYGNVMLRKVKKNYQLVITDPVV